LRSGQPDDAGGKALVRRLIDEVMNGGRLEVLSELYGADMAVAARRWIGPFREAFPDVHMEIVTLVAEGDTVAARFRCSATHLGEWQGHAPTGRTFRNVDEVYFFTIRDGRIASAWGLEDNDRRRRQLRL
jgi:predicted ester cyclase